jgi:hypothetical protein
LQTLLRPLTLAYSALHALQQLLHLQHLATLQQKFQQRLKALEELQAQLLMRTLLQHRLASLQ